MSAGKLAGLAVLIAGKLHKFKIFGDFLLDGLGIDASGLEAERDIFPDGHVGEEGVVLENGADGALIGWQVGNIDSIENYSPGVWNFKSSADSEEGCFPAAAGPQKRKHFTFINGKRHIVEYGILAVAFRNILKAQNFLHRSVRTPINLKVDVGGFHKKVG